MCIQRLDEDRIALIDMQGKVKEKVTTLRGQLEEASRALIEEIRS